MQQLKEINYTCNLATLSQDLRDIIEIDKSKYFKAWQWLRTLNRPQIVAELNAIECDTERDRMRLRLNKIIENNKRKKK
jgi:hypothetical protein